MVDPIYSVQIRSTGVNFMCRIAMLFITVLSEFTNLAFRTSDHYQNDKFCQMIHVITVHAWFHAFTAVVQRQLRNCNERNSFRDNNSFRGIQLFI